MAKIVKSEIAALMRENERLKAENARLAGYLEYVAMMADVELPDEEEIEEGEADV